MRREQMGGQPAPVGTGPSVLRGRGQGETEGAMPSVDLQDAEASRVQDDAIPQSPAMPDPADVTQDSPVGQVTTPGPRRTTRSTQGLAPQRLTYEVRGEPSTAYFLTDCYQKMIAGLVACVDQREHMQREFVAMMSSTDGTIENWPRSLREYPA